MAQLFMCGEKAVTHAAGLVGQPYAKDSFGENPV